MSHRFTILRLDHLDSTNLEAMRRARTGADDLAIIADSQSAGRGRHGREWASPQGNLFLSLLLRPDISPCRLGELAFVTAVAVADALRSFVSTVALKWPNDILIDEKKLGGILIENEIACDHVDFCVVGIGINIASKPDETRYPATCLADHSATATRDEVAAAILDSFTQRYAQWLETGFAAIRADWMALAWNLGAPIAIETGDTNLTGQFDGIDDTGALVLATETGKQQVLSGTLTYGQAV